MLRNAQAPGWFTQTVPSAQSLAGVSTRSADARGAVWPRHFGGRSREVLDGGGLRPAVGLPPSAYLVACGQPGDLAGKIVRFSGPGRERRNHHYPRSPEHARGGDDVFHPPDGLLPFRAHRRTSQEIAARDSFGARGAACFCRVLRGDALAQRRHDRGLQVLVAFALETNRGGRDARRADAGNAKTEGANRQKLAHEFSGASGMARISRLRPRRAFPGAENFDQLERSPAQAALENPGGPRLVLARSGWPHAFHP